MRGVAELLPLMIRRCSGNVAARYGALLFLSLGFAVLPISSDRYLFGNNPKIASICAIQGIGPVSAYQNQIIRVRGIVFADLDETSWKGFFLQAEACDSDPASSDGIFIYLGSLSNVVQQGDTIEVTGTVQEYAGMTEIRSLPEQVEIISRGNPLPAPVEVDPPFDEQIAFEYLESLEGMYVAVQQALVVGPLSSSTIAWVVRANLGIPRVFQDDPRGAGEVIAIASSANPALIPDVKNGDLLTSLGGFISETAGRYYLELLEAPILFPAPPQEPGEISPLEEAFSLSTFNLSNLFDTIDDPNTADDVLSAEEYQRRLKKRALTIHEVLGEPDILALQETENLSVLESLSARPEIIADYAIAWVESLDLRGQDVALLYRRDRMILLDQQSYQGCTGLVDGLGPDGNQDVLYPDNEITCDRNGDGVLDGNRLFSRPPLVARFQVVEVLPGNHLPIQLIVVANHWKSKVEDSDQIAYTQLRRMEEAVYISELVPRLHSQYPMALIAVIGDLNDYPASQPLTTLKAAGLADLSHQIDQTQRYSYNHRGISQVLDYVLITSALNIGTHVDVAHINTDFPAVFEKVADAVYRSSDHDPLRVDFYWLPDPLYLPLAFKGD